MCGIRHLLTVVEVDGLLHDAGLRRGNPQRKAGLLQAEAEEIFGPVPYLEAVENQNDRAIQSFYHA